MIEAEAILPTLRPENPAQYLESTIYLSDEVSPNNPGFLSLNG